MNNLVFDPLCVPEALLMLQLSLYALPRAADRYERRMRGIKELDALKRFDVTGRLADLTIPVSIVWGRQDARGNLTERKKMPPRSRRGGCAFTKTAGIFPIWSFPSDLICTCESSSLRFAHSKL